MFLLNLHLLAVARWDTPHRRAYFGLPSAHHGLPRRPGGRGAVGEGAGWSDPGLLSLAWTGGGWDSLAREAGGSVPVIPRPAIRGHPPDRCQQRSACHAGIIDAGGAAPRIRGDIRITHPAQTVIKIATYSIIALQAGHLRGADDRE